MNAEETSRIRKRIRERFEEMSGLLDILLKGKVLLKGYLYESKRRCGKETCVCKKGKLHSSTVLAYRRGDRQRNLYPLPEELPFLGKATSRYRRFRRSRAEFVKRYKELIALIGKLEERGCKMGKDRFRKTETGKGIEE